MPPRYANGHISATCDPIHFMFCSRVGFFGDGGSGGAIFDSNRLGMAAAVLHNFEWPYLRNGSLSVCMARVAWSSLHSMAFLYDDHLVVPLQGFIKANNYATIYETTCIPSYTEAIL